MSSSEFHERLRSNPLCDFRLGTVATSDHETPLTVGGGARKFGDPGDQGTCGVTSQFGVAVEHRWSETDAVLMASVGCVVERTLESLVL